MYDRPVLTTSGLPRDYQKPSVQLATTLLNVAKLYAQIFTFLSNYMDWLMRKRYQGFLDSFNGNVNKKFEKEITKIDEKSNMIRGLVARGSRAEIRETRLTREELDRDVRTGQRNVEDFSGRILRELQRAEEERRAFSQGFKKLSVRLVNMMQEQAMVETVQSRSIEDGTITHSTLPIL